jgi:AhpD family alkylhydroperoxidase
VSQTVTQANIAADPRVTELVALGAAIGSNCEACFRSHYETARSVGLSTEEIVRAVRVAEHVKETPARRIRELAARKLDVPVSALTGVVATPVAEHDTVDGAAPCGCEPAAQSAPVAEADPPAAECC